MVTQQVWLGYGEVVSLGDNTAAGRLFNTGESAKLAPYCRIAGLKLTAKGIVPSPHH